MNTQLLSEFFQKMSRDPDLAKEFVELAARHGIDLLDDQLSEAELATVSGGGSEVRGFPSLSLEESNAFGQEGKIDLQKLRAIVAADAATIAAVSASGADAYAVAMTMIKNSKA